MSSTPRRLCAVLPMALLLGCTPFFDTTGVPPEADTSHNHGGDSGFVGDTAGGTGPTCAAYCATIEETCVGTNAVYPDRETCLATCAASRWPGGTFEDTRGNSIGCRIKHANYALEGSPEVHCVHAGPTGGNICGTWCENMCDLSTRICTGDNEIFDSFDACLEACEPLPDDATPGTLSGNSVQCRIYHLGIAGLSEQNAAFHCPHGAVPSGGNVCGD